MLIRKTEVSQFRYTHIYPAARQANPSKLMPFHDRENGDVDLTWTGKPLVSFLR